MKTIPIFHPFMPVESVMPALQETLSSRFVGQGPKVDEFEKKFEEKLSVKNAVAVNSGTAALELAYDILDIEMMAEVVCPLFTCTATNIPILRRFANPVFYDIDPNTLNGSIETILCKVTPKTKAIVIAHLGGLAVNVPLLQSELKKRGLKIPIVEDAAQSIGAMYPGTNITIGQLGTFTMFSFQAIKHITTGDGGMLICPNKETAEEAKRRRWFGIDREAKIKLKWEPSKENGELAFDIKEIGHKFQMSDITATIGIIQLDYLEPVLNRHTRIAWEYFFSLKPNKHFYTIPFSNKHSWWTYPLIFKTKEMKQKVKKALDDHGIESNQVQMRNDVYSIFHGDGHYPGMDSVDGKYLYIPINTKVSIEDAMFVAGVINNATR